MRKDGGELRRELAMEHNRLRVGVVEQVAQLFLDVPVVHVDGDGPELERRQHGFHVLDAVIEVEGDVVARTDALRLEVVGEPVRAVLGVGEGEPSIAAHERLVVGHGVDDLLPQVGEVVFHQRLIIRCGPITRSAGERRRRRPAVRRWRAR
jgi:hypothetical protein